jgi:hypothetical protein
MTGETPKEEEFVDPFEGDAAYWKQTDLDADQIAALKDPASKLGRPKTGLRNLSTWKSSAAEVSDPAVTAATSAGTAEPVTPTTYPGGEAGLPDLPLLADVMGPELPPAHPQPE